MSLNLDLFYVSREHADVVKEAHSRGALDLVVEILSPGTRKTDEITKRKRTNVIVWRSTGSIPNWNPSRSIDVATNTRSPARSS